MENRVSGILLAATTATCWALLAIGLKLALQFSDPGTIVWYRMLVAFVLVSGFYVLRSPSQLRVFLHWPLLGVLAGLCLSTNYFGYMKGVELTSASNTQIMIQTAPMMLILIGIFYFKEKPSPLQGVGFILAGLGFSFFYWDQILVAVHHQETFHQGNLWILLAAVTWATFATSQKIASRVWSPQQINLMIYAIATVALFFLATPQEVTEWSLPVFVLMTVLGINTVVAYGCLGEALRRIPASHVSVIISANPLLTIFIMTLLDHNNVTWIEPEPIDWRGYIGAFFVVSGVILTVRQKSHPKMKKS